MTGAEIIIGPTISGIVAAVRLLQLSLSSSNVSERARIFVRLVDQVDRDLEYALRCRVEGVGQLERYSGIHHQWISSAINRTLSALEYLGQVVDKSPQKGVHDKLEFMLKNYDRLVDQERSLSYAHASLLAAINAMHLMMFQSGPPVGRPSLSSLSSSNNVRRASHKPPTESPSPPLRESTHLASPFSDSESTGRAYSSISIDTFDQATVPAYIKSAEKNLQQLQKSKEMEIWELDSMSI